jgi:FAD/FMN-containing dehydrogenase
MQDLDFAIAASFQNSGAELIRPGDDKYETARAVWNGAIDRRPALIVRPKTAGQVAHAVGFARATGLEVSVRGGGHSYAGNAVCDGGLMIDLAAMNRVTVDPSTRRASCGGGATWRDLDAAAQEHALGVTGGTVSNTGVAGLTLGGGMGWLAHRLGLSCDNLVSAELVTADGGVVTASADSNPELFWALRGGGGNFGVVTTFEFALSEVPTLAQLGLFFWDPEQIGEALQFCRTFLAALPAGCGALINGITAPAAPFVPTEHQGTVGLVLGVVGWGSADAHAAVVAPVRELAPPLWELVTPLPYVQLQQLFDEDSPPGVFAYEKSLYLDELTDEAIEVLAAQIPLMSSPMSDTPIFPLTGAYRRVPDQATAFGGSRKGGWLVNMAAATDKRDVYDAERARVREFYEALRPHATGSGSYVNLMSNPDEELVRESYGPEKYRRLQSIKRHWDPHNVFHRNANIRPDAG